MSDKIVSTKPKPFVFVLMPFDTKFSDTYKFGIKGAADDAGAYAERVDEQNFVEGMLDRIFNQISKADVIVADMTGRNPNVFYEVGYAHALDKVVLLITQSADDIPFDLKHRHHIIYGGSIELLRQQLAGRIAWAIAESERRGVDASSAQISVRLSGVELTQGITATPAHTINHVIVGTSFTLPVQILNRSERGLLQITHAYLFSSPDAAAKPVFWPQISETNIVYPGISVISELESFIADSVDAPDGLTKQYKLPVELATMPPRVIDGMQLNFQLDRKSCDALFRLRLHTTTQYFDFPFRIFIEQAPREPHDF